MSLKIEVAELMEKPGVMFDVAEKVEYKRNLTNEEKEIFERSVRPVMIRIVRLPHLLIR